MSVRAKFKVDEIKRQKWSKTSDEVRSIILSPVYGNGDPNHENTKFWNATPTGKIELGTINLAAAADFELGKEYYVDFTAAE